MSQSAALPEPLNSREKEILRLIADGLSNGEIAAKLFLTEGTVKWYNTQIFGKLGVKNRVEAIRSMQGHKPALAPPSSATQDLYVGRGKELDEVIAMLQAPDSRLVTILGPGGIGKTTLAHMVAAASAQAFAAGVYQTELAALTDGGQIAPAIADAIGLRSIAEKPLLPQLFATLAGKHALLVLDNVEQLTDGAMHIKALLDGASSVRLLVTSRERLNLQDERVYRLEGLPLPDALPTLDDDAIALFARHALQAKPTLLLDAAALTEMARICTLVHGMPLAIVLAAASADAFSLREIGDEVARSLDVLETELHDVPARHRSMRGVLDSTWARLSPAEQDAFAKLSIFRGGFTREAALAVTGMNVRTLAALHGKALVRNEGGRYAVHELLRQYAEAKLAGFNDVDTVTAKHATYFLGNLSAAERALLGRERIAIETTLLDFENIRLAWIDASSRSATAMLDASLKAFQALCKFGHRMRDACDLLTMAINQNSAFELHQKLTDARVYAYEATGQHARELEETERALGSFASSDMTQRKSWLLTRMGIASRKLTRLDISRLALQSALGGFEAAQDVTGQVEVLYQLGEVILLKGEVAEARKQLERSITLVEVHRISGLAAIQAYHGLGDLLVSAGELKKSIALLERSLDLSVREDETEFELENLNMLGHASGMMGMGQFVQSLSYFDKGLTRCEQSEMPQEAGFMHVGVSHIHAWLGNHALALKHAQQGLTWAKFLGNISLEVASLDCLGQIYQDVGRIDLSVDIYARILHIMKVRNFAFVVGRITALHAISQIRVDGEANALLPTLKEFLVSDERNASIFGVSELLIALCECYSALGEAQALKATAERAVALCKKCEMFGRYAKSLIWLGISEEMLLGTGSGVNSMQQALVLAQTNSYHRVQVDANRALQRAYANVGDETSAIKHRSTAEALIAEIRENLKDHPDLLQGLHLL